MISGKFALASRQTYASYYYKKFVTIGVPMLIFFFIRTLYIAWHSSFDNLFLSYFLNVIGLFGDTEYWFLYVLIGNLLVAPILRETFGRFTKRECRLFLGLGLGFNFCTTVFAILSINFEYTYIFGGWTMYFYLSCCVEPLLENKRGVHLLWICTGICLLITVIFKYQGITVYVHDISPVFTIFTLGMYSIFLTIGRMRFSSKAEKMFIFLSKHSFSVYLIHMMVLETVIEYSPSVTGGGSIVRHILVTLGSLVVSVGLSATLDKFLIKPICRKLLSTGHFC